MTLIGKYGVIEDVEPVLPPVVLYDGEVTIRFDEHSHRYSVQDRAISTDWFHPSSVTRILSTVDKSEALVPWATKCGYERFKEMIVPGVAYDAPSLEKIGRMIQFAHEDVKNRACDIGKGAHAWIEKYLIYRAGRGDCPSPPTDLPVRSCCSAARKWILETDLKPVLIERILYSRKHELVGTADATGAISRVNGELSTVDWKSSNTAEGHAYEWQLAAYSKMYEEMTGTKVPGRIIVRLDKENSTPYPKILPPEELERDFSGFLGLLRAHNRLKEMESN